jgi:hypothetical protein
MHLQKFMGWLSKNFILQGLVSFVGVKSYMLCVEILKKRHNAVGWTFCGAIIIRPDKRVHNNRASHNPI